MYVANKTFCIVFLLNTIYNVDGGKTPDYISNQFSATVNGRRLTYAIGPDALIQFGETSIVLVATETDLSSDGSSFTKDVILKVAINFTAGIEIDGDSYLRNERKGYDLFQAENNKASGVEKLRSPEIYYLERLEIFNTDIVLVQFGEFNFVLIHNTEDKKALVMGMELMGENVGDYISSIPFTDYKRRLEFLLRVEAHILKNLKVAKQAGITHNDIKADNLVFAKKGCYDIDSIALIDFAYATYDGCYIAIAYRGSPLFIPIRVHQQYQKGTTEKLNETEPYKPWFQDDVQSSLYWFFYATKEFKADTAFGESTITGLYDFKTTKVEDHIKKTFPDAVCAGLNKTLLDIDKNAKPPKKEFDHSKSIGELITHANVVASGNAIAPPV